VHGVIDHKWPHHVAIAANDGVCAAKLVCLVWIERGVNPAEYHRSAARPRSCPDLVPAQGISRVDPDPDHVTGSDRVEIERLEGFIDDAWGAVDGWGSRANHEQPARGDDANAE